MSKHDPFRNSELDRAKPKRHMFHSFINDKLKRHRSDTGLVEDRTSSVTIVRIIVGLLMIHLIIIGGVLLRGHMVKEGNAGLATPVSITPPPPAPPMAQTEAPVQDVLPQPTAPAVAKPAVASNHITQAADIVVEDDIAVDPEEEPVIIVPPSAAAAAAEPVQHLVAPGDSWLRIASQYGTTEAALKAANPQAARGVLRSGIVLVVPNGNQATAPAQARSAAPVAQVAPAPSTPHQQAAAQPAAASTAKVHTVQRGESLSAIARKTKVPVKTLMEINGIKNANRIFPGMQLRLSR